MHRNKPRNHSADAFTQSSRNCIELWHALGCSVEVAQITGSEVVRLIGIPQLKTKGLKTIGRMQEGMDADIVVFDPETVKDNSTYAVGKGAMPSTGIPYVLVNGVIVVKDSEVLKVFPGKPIRFPVEERGRLDQIEVDPRAFDPNQS